MNLVAWLTDRPARLGPARLLRIDGPSGSGKTTLADSLGLPSIRLDDLYPGWRGLGAIEEPVRSLLAELAATGSGGYRRWDWDSSAPGAWVPVTRAPLMVLEGVGAGSRAFDAFSSGLVWVDRGTASARVDAVLARDRADYRSEMEQWQRDEQALFAREQTRDRADIVMEDT